MNDICIVRQTIAAWEQPTCDLLDRLLSSLIRYSIVFVLLVKQAASVEDEVVYYLNDVSLLGVLLTIENLRGSP